MESFCDVVFNRPLNQSFTYRIPPHLLGSLKIGQRVRVSFGKSDTLGYVVGLSKTPGNISPKNIKELKEIIDKTPLLDENMLKLARWINEYYFCSLGEALSLFFPAGWRSVGKTAPARIQEKKTDLSLKGLSSQPFLPTLDQSRAIEKVSQALEKKERKVFLLHGVTASGKTEVYMQLAAKARAMGGGVIVLVPEIVLAHEIVRIFHERFGRDVAIWHSKLSEGKRYEEWLKLRCGQAHIVIGPRSAVFSPLENIRLVIVDEEHETAYKESRKNPRYHGRDLAIMRAGLSSAVTVLGSATPSLESYYNAQRKKYELIELPIRVDASKLPEVRIIDLKKMPKDSFFSEELKEAIKERLQNKEQVILFINRRGFSYFILCQACGHVLKCRNCQVSLTYHRGRDTGLCHYCGYRERVTLKCPICKNEALRYMGVGTEKVEEEVKNLFPEARVRRLDSDVTQKRTAITKILADLRSRRIDVLVGTQMAAKGLDFPYVTLIGVILADSGLNVPDFRAGERTFQLLTQVAGRSGRGRRPGLCIIQSYNPAHYSIATSAAQNYSDFFNEEIKFRQELYYPPICRFIRVVLRGKAEVKVKEGADKLAKSITGMINPDTESAPGEIRYSTFLTGPSPAPLYKLKGKYRWQICLKTKNMTSIQKTIRDAIEKERPSLKNLDVIIDSDPVDMF